MSEVTLYPTSEVLESRLSRLCLYSFNTRFPGRDMRSIQGLLEIKDTHRP